MSKVRIRHTGRFTTEAAENKRLKQIEAGKKRKIVPVDDSNEGQNESVKNEMSTGPVTGYRLIDYDFFTQKMRCVQCKSVLDPAKTEGELKLGLHSVFKIRCEDCLLLNSVPSSRTHDNSGKSRNVPDINGRIALSRKFLF